MHFTMTNYIIAYGLDDQRTYLQTCVHQRLKSLHATLKQDQVASLQQFSMLNLAKHEICPLINIKLQTLISSSFAKEMSITFNLLINTCIKMQTTDNISIFISRMNIKLNYGNHGKSFITSGSVFAWILPWTNQGTKISPSNPRRF